MNKYFTVCIFLAIVSGSVSAAGPQPSIVNGQTTQDEPSVGALLVSLVPGASPPSYAGVCTGTMIGCSSFLTAAHCVCESTRPFPNSLRSEVCQPRPAEELRVYLQNSGIHQVSAVNVHPRFKFGVASDIAVLTLSAPEQGIPPMALNTAGTPGVGTPGGIVGFGVTSSAADDYGIKRVGNLVTANCADADIPQPANICWKYSGAEGGADSNICFGDSGGPLLISQGFKRIVAGVSSGVFENCSANSFSFGTNVYANRGYINSQIVNTMDQTGKCRIDVRNRVKKYITSVYNAKKQCLDAALAGKAMLANCLLTKAKVKIDKAQAALGADKLVKRCPSDVIENSKLGGACADVTNPNQLSACIIAAGDVAVSRMLDAQYADVEADFPLIDKGLSKCQKAISNAGKNYFFKSLGVLNQCEAKTDKSRSPLPDCPLLSTNASQDKFAGSIQNSILKACPNGAVAGLLANGDRFGASCDSKTDAAALAECEQKEHAQIANELAAMVPGKPSAFNAENCGFASQVGDSVTEVIQQTRSSGEAVLDAESVLHKFEVPAGVRFLRVTLNGEESFLPSSFSNIFIDNSLDLYLRYQQTPSINPLAADAISINTGVFEAIQVKNPAAGEWRALVHDAGAVSNRPYQLTVTLIK
ncbi:MAG: trypsin-like serine protease [Methylomicrobium sp.]